MPKIKKHSFTIDSNDIRQVFEVDIMYSSRYLFHAIIPEKFNEVFDNIPDDELKTHFGMKIYRDNDNYNRGDFKRGVTAPTEKECESRIYDFVKHLMEQSIIKKDVIIIDYQGDLSTTYFYIDNQKVKISLQLIFATQTKIGATGIPKFIKYHQYTDPFDSKKTRVTKYDIDTRHSIVIDDTPENRQFLENLYSKLIDLKNKMDAHIKDSYTVLQLIASNSKLLGS